jgi:hypothetical protein
MGPHERTKPFDSGGSPGIQLRPATWADARALLRTDGVNQSRRRRADLWRQAVSRLPGRLAGADDGPVGDRAGVLAAFCVVANVAQETASGEGGLEVRAGVRHFAPGGVGAAAAVGRRGPPGNRGGSPPGDAWPPGTGPDGDAAAAPDAVPCAGRVQPGGDPGAGQSGRIVVTGRAREALHSPVRQGHSPSGRHGRNRTLPILQARGQVASRRDDRHPQDEERVLSRQQAAGSSPRPALPLPAGCRSRTG